MTQERFMLTDGNTIYDLNEEGTNKFSALVQGYKGTAPIEVRRIANLMAMAPQLLEALETCYFQKRCDPDRDLHEVEQLGDLVKMAKGLYL